MARPRKERPKAWFGVDYAVNDTYSPVLTIRLYGFGSLTLRCNINVKYNWVSHLAATDCPESIGEVLNAAKMYSKIEPFKGPIPSDPSTIVIYYANQIANLGFEISTDSLLKVTPELQTAIDHHRTMLTELAEEGTHAESN